VFLPFIFPVNVLYAFLISYTRTIYSAHLDLHDLFTRITTGGEYTLRSSHFATVLSLNSLLGTLPTPHLCCPLRVKPIQTNRQYLRFFLPQYLQFLFGCQKILEVLGRTNRLLSFVRHGPHIKHFVATGTCLPSRFPATTGEYTETLIDSPLIRDGPYTK
jgi:hypothetical protein